MWGGREVGAPGGAGSGLGRTGRDASLSIPAPSGETEGPADVPGLVTRQSPGHAGFPTSWSVSLPPDRRDRGESQSKDQSPEGRSQSWGPRGS